MDLQYEVEGGILEEGLNHAIVQIVEDGFYYPSYHSHTHAISFLLELFEDLKECIGEGLRVEEVVLNQILGVFGLIEYVGEVVFVWHFKGLAAADFQVVLADFFANQPPMLYLKLHTRKSRTTARLRRKLLNPHGIYALSHSTQSPTPAAFRSYCKF